MKHKKNGSALLFVIMATTLLMIWATGVMRTAVFTADLALQRQLYEQKMAAVEGVLNYGVGWSKKHFYELVVASKQGAQEATVDVGVWKIGGQDLVGKLTINTQDHLLKLCACLHDGITSVCQTQCFVQAVGNDEEQEGENAQQCYKIAGWHYVST